MSPDVVDRTRADTVGAVLVWLVGLWLWWRVIAEQITRGGKSP